MIRSVRVTEDMSWNGSLELLQEDEAGQQMTWDNCRGYELEYLIAVRQVARCNPVRSRPLIGNGIVEWKAVELLRGEGWRWDGYDADGGIVAMVDDDENHDSFIYGWNQSEDHAALIDWETE